MLETSLARGQSVGPLVVTRDAECGGAARRGYVESKLLRAGVSSIPREPWAYFGVFTIPLHSCRDAIRFVRNAAPRFNRL